MKRALIAVAVFVCAVVPFARSVRYGIVNCDDYSYAATYKAVTDGVTGAGLQWALTFEGEGIWMPLTWLSYMVDYDVAAVIWGANAPEDAVYHVMHAHSVFWHGLNAVLLWTLLCLVMRCGLRAGEGVAVLAALIWAVHPLRVESVAWIASRKDLLSMAGLLGALICWVKWRMVNREQGPGNGGRRTWSQSSFYVLSILCFALGAMAKPSVMCFPALVVILDWFILRRGLRNAEELIRMAVGYVLPVALAAAVAILAQRMQTVGGCTVELKDVPLWGRLLNAAVSFGVYPLNTVVPISLAPQCLMRWPGTPRLMVPGLVIAAVILWWMWRGMRSEADRLRAVLAGKGVGVDVDSGRWILAGATWYVLSIIPFLGISAFGYHALADRFTYIPAVGLSLALVGLWKSGTGNGERRTALPLVIIAAVATTAVLGALTWRQTGFWRNDRAMWEQTIRVDGEGNGVATAGLGLWYFEHDHGSSESIRWFDKSFSTDPDCMQKTGFIYINNLAERGMLKEAAERLKWSAAWSAEIRDQERAAKGMDASVEMKPLIHHRLAKVAYLIHNPDLRAAGEDELKELEVLRPGNIHVLYLRGQLSLMKGDVAGAERAWAHLKAAATRKECVWYRFFGDVVARAKCAAGNGGGGK